MPGANLTQQEAIERRGVVRGVPQYAVALDLTGGDKSDGSEQTENFGSVTTVTFDAEPGASTFLDLIVDSADRVESVELNGRALDPAAVYKDSRIELEGLAEHNTVTVAATCQYSHTGEGLHRSVDPSDGNVYLYSQFEVPDARRVYAVFDQPDIKAVFTFTVTAPESWTVVTNMPAADVTAAEPATAGDQAAEATKTWSFEPTPAMSSYLTAFCAGPYASWHTEYANEDGRTVPMGIYCRQALKDAMAKDVDYLFDITKKGFAFYNEQWGVPYPYAKYDQLFVPEYNAGAMENIGTVTIRDSYVFESKVTDALAERRVVTVLHELAHMWFGDLVTMKWWNDLWLNESFAEFMSTLCTAEATDWKDAWATFSSGEKSWGEAQDQRPTTHPIVAPIHDLNDTYVNFDGITYAKGASVLRQLVAYVGRKPFFAGIHSYLTKHAYGNATLADLLAELEKASGRDLKAWSATWLEQSGITTLGAKVDTAADGTITGFTIEQTAPAEHPVLRPHRLAVGFYDVADGEDTATGRIVRTARFELDVDGAATQVTEAIGRKRPAFILINDDDLTYAKLRFDPASLDFALKNLYRFDDALARSIVWLALWDMTRDAELPAESFIETSLAALATERESTTFRYALGQVSTAAFHYTAASRRKEMVSHVATRLWQLANEAAPGSDEQFQLVNSWLGYGQGDDFEADARGLLDGTVTLDGLEIDNNMRWGIIVALASAGFETAEQIDAELAKNETTENRQFAYMAKGAIPTPEAKAWAWDTALHDDTLTNSQIEDLAGGFSLTPSPELQEPYVAKYFEAVDWVWKNRTFHMSEALLQGTSRGSGLYPGYADPAALVQAGDAWLASHEDADRALRRMGVENVDGSRRTLRVRTYNDSLA